MNYVNFGFEELKVGSKWIRNVFFFIGVKNWWIYGLKNLKFGVKIKF